jgi:hypothetical protein
MSESIGNDDSSHTVSVVVGGLAPGTAYHFRVVAINFSGTTSGGDTTFTTATGSSPPPTETKGGGSLVHGQSPSGTDCKKLAARAREAKKKATAARRRSKRSPGSKGLKAQAKRTAREARALSHKATACGGNKADK